MPKFSIIIPIYNVEQYLPKCLDSLVNQTYADIEIICVNDGSPDNSLQILKKYASKDERIKIINQENQGVSIARNVGINNATGDYILFVDADDWIETNTCNILNKNIEKNNLDLIIFNAYIAKNNQCNLGFRCNQESIMYSSMWSICYKREFLNQNNIRFPQNIKIAEDHVFRLNALSCSKNIKILQDYLYYYLADRENSASKIKTVILEDIKTFEYLIEQDWFKNTSIKNQSNIVNFWLKLIGGTLFAVPNDYIHIQELNDYIGLIKNMENFSEYNLKNLKNLEIFILLQKLHLFEIYRKIIRPIGKYCIVLPYRRFKEFLRSKNG